MHASAVGAVFNFSAYTATSFELRCRSCTSTHLCISFMQFNFQFFSSKFENNSTECNITKNNDVQLQNSNLKFGIMSISYL